ncbi:glycosyltransferase family 2 protein, partial [Arthrospira platensis SPKY1]|nr:glycosyltransferase family 2 protein [Arthrospira platensis SPKY1]
DRLLKDNFADILMFRLMQFWGTYQGFRQHGKISSQLKQTFYYPNGLKRSRPPETGPENSQRLVDYASLSEEKEIARNH